MSRFDVDAFLARLDQTVTECGTCGRALSADGPSLYYCNERCAPGGEWAGMWWSASTFVEGQPWAARRVVDETHVWTRLTPETADALAQLSRDDVGTLYLHFAERYRAP